MQAVKICGDSKVEIVEVPDPVAGNGEVVIRTAVSAICGSEMHGYRNGGIGDKVNGGHEAAGVVASLGEGVTSLKVGQRVGVSAVSGCGNCEYCSRGQYTWCKGLKGYSNMHSEQFVIAANACHVLPDDLGWDAAVLLTGDGLGVPYHTSTKITSEEINTVAIFGVGPIGLGNVLVQSYLGRRVIAVDVSDYRLEAANKLGAAETVNASDGKPAEKIIGLTGGKGADVCIEAAGRPETALACFDAVRTAGTVIFNGEQGELALSPSKHFIRRDITAIGAWFYHFSEFHEMLQLYRDGLKVTNLISDHYKFTGAPEAYRKFAAGESSKTILNYDSER